MKTRLDDLMLSQGLAADKREAHALIIRGVVLVNEQRIDKPGTFVERSDEIRLTLQRTPYVSRGGEKLEAAIRHFNLKVNGMICADLGASTGGFTDCLLKHGARRVYAFDVGRGQLSWRLQTDKRVVVRDEFNVRFIKPSDIPEKVDLLLADLAFISLRKIFPALEKFEKTTFLLLVKPQFEAEREEVEEGGLITDPKKREEIVRRVVDEAQEYSFSMPQTMRSPVPGQKGNREYFLLTAR